MGEVALGHWREWVTGKVPSTAQTLLTAPLAAPIYHDTPSAPDTYWGTRCTVKACRKAGPRPGAEPAVCAEWSLCAVLAALGQDGNERGEGGGGMTFSLNSVSLIGEISQYGVRLQKNGKASCTVKLRESGRDGQEHVSFVPIEVWGTPGAAEAIALASAAVVLVQGVVKPRKAEDQWTVMVSCRELQLLDRLNEEEYDTEAAG